MRAWMRYGSTRSGMSDAMLVPDPSTGLLSRRPGYVQESQRSRSGSTRSASAATRSPRDEAAKDNPDRHRRRLDDVLRRGSSNQATWPAQLQALLQKAHPEVRIEVINAGMPGYVIDRVAEESRAPCAAAETRTRHLLRGEQRPGQ